MIDREKLDSFQSPFEEPVATLMSAWYLWAKWNWPPSKDILPKLLSIHYDDHQITGEPGSPIKFEYLTGPGADYLNAFGPVGCRDIFTLDTFRSLGIDAYFSGCITLTLPRMHDTADKGRYVCAVDIDGSSESYLRRQAESAGLDVKPVTHYADYRLSDATWAQRKAYVKQLLVLYQNAHCVVTTRLHCALPCLAMDVPVLLLIKNPDSIRYDPYIRWLHHVTPSVFAQGAADYDILNPPENSGEHKPTRTALVAEAESFVSALEDKDFVSGLLAKQQQSTESVLQWQNDRMKQSLALWLMESRKARRREIDLHSKIDKMTADLKAKDKELQNLKRTVDKNKKQLKSQKETIQKQTLLLNSRTVRFALKIRGMLAKLLYR